MSTHDEAVGEGKFIIGRPAEGYLSLSLFLREVHVLEFIYKAMLGALVCQLCSSVRQPCTHVGCVHCVAPRTYARRK